MKSSAEYRASVTLLQYCPPVLLVLGTFGNVMTLVILRRMTMKHSAMPVYLAALAVNDTALLYTGLLRYWILNVFDYDVRSLHPAMCKMHTWLVYSLIIISPWILTFMTAERTLSVWKPHRVSVMCTRGKAKLVLLGIVVGSLLVNSHLLYGMNIVSNNGSRTCFAPDEDYLHFFDAVWAWVDLTLASLLPFTVLLVGNTLIVCKVYSSVRAARDLGSVRGENDVKHRQKKVSSMTVTLVALNVVFFLTTCPICVYNIIEHYIEGHNSDAIDGPGSIRLAWAVVNILMYINSVVNFYLYSLSGSNFRKELRTFLGCPPASSAVKNNYLEMNNQHHLNHDNIRHLHHQGSDHAQHGVCRYPSDPVCNGGGDVPDSRQSVRSTDSRTPSEQRADPHLTDSSSDF